MTNRTSKGNGRPGARPAAATAIQPLLVAPAGNRATATVVSRVADDGTDADRDALIRVFEANMDSYAFDTAATTLNQFGSVHNIGERIAVSDPNKLFNLRIAATTLKFGHIIEAIDAYEATNAPKTEIERRNRMLTRWAEMVRVNDWDQAAVLLNGFGRADMDQLLGPLLPDQLTRLKTSAVQMMPGWGQAVSDAIRARNPDAAAAGQQESDLQGALLAKDWFAVADHLARLTESQSVLVAMRVRRQDMAGAAAVIGQSRTLLPAQIYAFSNGQDGARMPPEVRAGLGQAAAVWPIQFLEAAFEHRFGLELEGSWGVEILRIVWAQLERLPAWDIDLVQHIKTRAEGGGAELEGTVTLGQSVYGLEDFVRHEVGHAVHERAQGMVDAWLSGTEFVQRGSDVDGLRYLIRALGGFPSTFVDPRGRQVPFGADERASVMQLLTEHTQSGGTFRAATTLPGAVPTVGPGKTPTPAQIAMAAWAAMPAALHACFEVSRADWWQQYTSWPQAEDGGVCWNHYYSCAMSMGPAAFAVIPTATDRYSAMSPRELFASCYSEYFKNYSADPEHREKTTDEAATKLGGRLPDGVKHFMQNFTAPTIDTPRDNSFGVPQP